MRISFRTGFSAGLVLALSLGFCLFPLWAAPNQVSLHSAHLLTALEKKSWSAVTEFLDPSYSDQWGRDRAAVLAQLQQVLTYAHHLRLSAPDVVVIAAGSDGTWRARVTMDADPNEVSTFLQERVNKLDQPFVLQWQRVSWKPWDWKLVRVTNPALEIPDQLY